MRVTNEMMVSNALHRLSTRLSGYERAQSQLATGRRTLAPSGDPTGSARQLSLRAALRSREQETRNASDAMTWLDLADSQLQAAVERLRRVRDVAVRGASSSSVEERAALANEVAGVRSELHAIANFRHRGRPLFAGFAGADPVTRSGTDWVYAGDGGEITRRVGAEDVVTVNVRADDVFGFDPADPTANLFAVLDELEGALRAGDTTAVATMIGDVDVAQGRMTDALSRVGTSANWVHSAQRRSEDGILRIRGELSEVEDVDMAEAVMELQVQEVAYQATLQALSRALPPSLVSFLG